MRPLRRGPPGDGQTASRPAPNPGDARGPSLTYVCRSCGKARDAVCCAPVIDDLDERSVQKAIDEEG